MSTDKETTETLVERSQRILGVSLDSPDPEDPSAQSSASTGSNNRRKAQVSQAQRTHRRRTQRYIRELETEVLRVRSRERQALQQVAALEAQLRAHDIEPRPVESFGATSPNTQARDNEDVPFHLSTSVSSASSGVSGATTAVSVDLSPLNMTTPAYSCSDTASKQPPPDIAFLHDIPNQISRAREVRMTNRSPGDAWAELIDLDAQVAVDFILQLERSCLPHIRYAVEHHGSRTPSKPWLDNAGGPDHVLTATRGLLSARPVSNDPNDSAQTYTSQPGPVAIQSQARAQSFSISQSQVDDLLAASARLDLEHELTPVQVWQRMVETAGIGRIDRGTLLDVTDAFRNYSFCNSYGSVCHKTVVDVVLGCFFPGYIKYYHSSIIESPSG